MWHAPARQNQIAWPFNQRSLLSLWNAVYLSHDQFQPNTAHRYHRMQVLRKSTSDRDASS